MSGGLSFSIKGDIHKMTQSLNRLQKTLVPTATITALNKTGTRIKTNVVRNLSTRTGIQQKILRKRIRIYKARRNRAVLTVWFGSYDITYASFTSKRSAVKTTKTGIRIGRRQFPGAFRATMKSGHTDYYQRTGKARLPIKKAAVSIEHDANAVMSKTRVFFAPIEFKKQFHYELNRRLKNAGY